MDCLLEYKNNQITNKDKDEYKMNSQFIIFWIWHQQGSGQAIHNLEMQIWLEHKLELEVEYQILINL